MNPTDFQPLAKEFDIGKHHFRQLKREGDVALFEKSASNHPELSWEVVEIQTYEEGERFGKWYPKRELMPSSETWGRLGFTYCSREEAEKGFVKRCPA